MASSSNQRCPLRISDVGVDKAVCLREACVWWLSKGEKWGVCAIYRIAEVLDKKAGNS